MDRRGPVQSLVFFVLYFFYLWIEIDLSLVYHGGPAVIGFHVFFKGWPFLRQHLSQPAGLLEYLSAFLAQLSRFPWAGALLGTLQAWMIARATAGYLRAMEAFRRPGVRFIGPLLLLVGYAEYRYQFNVATLALGAMLLAWAYVRFRPAAVRAAFPLYLTLHLGAYVVAGGAHLLFAVLIAVHEWRVRRRWPLVLGYLASAAVLPIVVGRHLFGVVPAEAVTYSLLAPLEPRVYGEFPAVVAKLLLLYLFLPLTAVILAWGQGEADGGSGGTTAGVAWRWAGMVAPLALGAVAALLFRDADRRAELAVGCHAYHGRWEAVLEVAEDLSRRDRYPNPGVLHVINRALYHTGRLGFDLFRYPQDPRFLLMSDETFPDIYVSWYRFDTLLDLGQLNYAEFHLNHCAEFFGPRPTLLRRMAFLHLVKGDLPTAKVYLNALARVPFEADGALRTLERLKTDPSLKGEARVQALRGCRIDRDRPVHPTRYEDRTGFADMERMLLELLEKNPRNRMAAEYLMCLYLLNRRSDKAAGHVGRLRDVGFSTLPRLYEEALLLANLVHGFSLESVPFEIGAGARARAEEFMAAVERYRQDPDPRPWEGFRDSYWFYCLGPGGDH